MTHASLFSGIGGFDLAAEWMGWNNLFHCEWNPFGQKVLKHHFPNSISYNDITKTDFTIHEGSVDILTGGFPCQPYSTAGKRLGKQDERHLFPEMLRCIKEVKPRWVIGENVRGLVSWNEGLVFHEVHDDLEREGYEVQSFLIPAAGVNAPHQRYRVWFVAYSNDKGRSSRPGEVQSKNGEISKWNNNAESSNTNNIIAADTFSLRLEHGQKRGDIFKCTKETQGERCESSESIKTNGINGVTSNSSSNGGGQDNWTGKSRFFNQEGKTHKWDNFPTKSPICGGDDGLPRELDGITFSKWRKESIKAYGNAIVPQVAHQIFKTIEEFDKLV
jgi:DNA (cytosine-5)-methyltransferase 1